MHDALRQPDRVSRLIPMNSTPTPDEDYVLVRQQQRLKGIRRAIGESFATT